MEWGPHLKFLEGLGRKTGVTPQALLKRPKGLGFLEHMFYDAYNTISQGRTYYGEGYPNSLQISEISAYINLVGVYDRDTAVRLFSVVKRMDDAYLDFWVKRHRSTK